RVRHCVRGELVRPGSGRASWRGASAAAWCPATGLAVEVLEYSLAAADPEEAAGLRGKLWLPVCRQGRYATAQRWFDRLADRGGGERDPMIAAQTPMGAADIRRPGGAGRGAGEGEPRQKPAGPRTGGPGGRGWGAAPR